MVNSYDDMQGTPMDVESHPAYDKPDATQHYAGDVLPMPGEKSLGSGMNGMDPNSISYAVGSKKDPKILSIGPKALNGWAGRTGARTNGN